MGQGGKPDQSAFSHSRMRASIWSRGPPASFQGTSTGRTSRRGCHRYERDPAGNTWCWAAGAGREPLGALLDLYFLAHTLVPPGDTADPHLLVPARILFAVCAFRCLFPNQYKGNVVFHDTPLSSIFLTRLLATFAEVAFVYQLSHVLRLLDVARLGWVGSRGWRVLRDAASDVGEPDRRGVLPVLRQGRRPDGDVSTEIGGSQLCVERGRRGAECASRPRFPNVIRGRVASWIIQ
jgi:hypothetical protein